MKPCTGKLLSDVFDQFEEAGCFALKVVYGFNQQKIRVDYGLTLSCLNIVNEAANSTRMGKTREEVKSREQATTASQKRQGRTHFSFSESQPPHMRNCLPEQVMTLAEDGSLDLTMPLSDVSADSFFAVHYHFIKAMACGPASDSKPSTFGTGVFATNFLAYYGLSPAL